MHISCSETDFKSPQQWKCPRPLKEEEGQTFTFPLFYENSYFKLCLLGMGTGLLLVKFLSPHETISRSGCVPRCAVVVHTSGVI